MTRLLHDQDVACHLWPDPLAVRFSIGREGLDGPDPENDVFASVRLDARFEKDRMIELEVSKARRPETVATRCRS